MELHPDIWFSKSELEQAGLLDDTDSCDVATPPELSSEVGDHQKQQLFCNMQSPVMGSCSRENRLQTLVECWQEPCLASISSLQESTATQRVKMWLCRSQPCKKPHGAGRSFSSLLLQSAQPVLLSKAGICRLTQQLSQSGSKPTVITRRSSACVKRCCFQFKFVAVVGIRPQQDGLQLPEV